MRRCRNTVGPVSKIDFIQVKLEDFLLAQVVLDLQREKYLFHLAQVGFFAAEEKVTRHLHGNSAAALAFLAGADQFHCGAYQTLIIHPGVLEEAVILGRQNGVDYRLGQLSVANRRPALLTKFGDQFTVAGIHP